ncbi:MAG: nucleic acid-binding protein [Isosphaeraceae bacterium]|nr:nucleic acid-binding protein [Isosphaeraceae bacterium]
MPATAENLRELHELHRRAKALRDLMVSGPKTLAARKAVLARRQADLEEARKALKEGRAQVKNKEVQIQSLQNKIDDLLSKRNQVRKQDEYNALTNQMAIDKKAIDRLEVEVLEGMEANDARAAEVTALEAEVKKLADEVAALEADLATRAENQRAQLHQLEAAIIEAEAIIPEDQRDQYRRILKQRGADAMAAVEDYACTGCFVTVTAQTMNELINTEHLVFCKSCGRVLYLAEVPQSLTRRSTR